MEKQLFSPDLGNYRTYGIAAAETPGQRQVRQAFLSDVSPDGAFTADLARHCTQEGLEPVHLPDVVPDAI